MDPGPTMRERMLAGALYIADDPDLARESARAQRLTHEINTVVGAGSVVLRDVPAGVLAVGWPARVVRTL
jgi:maltose O-acetyltransferase